MLVLLSMVILVYFWSWILIFTRQCPLTCIDDMHIDMLGVAGAGVALVLPGVLLTSEARVDIIIDIIIDITIDIIIIDIRYLSGVADDEAGGGHVPSVRDHNLDIDRYRYL